MTPGGATMGGTEIAVAPPAHLVMQAATDEAAVDGTQIAEEETRAEKLQQRRQNHDDKKNRRQTQSNDKRTRLKDKKTKKRDRRRRQRDAKAAEAEIQGCEDFETFEEAEAFYKSPSYDRVRDPLDLDLNGDGEPCNDVPADFEEDLESASRITNG
jgi:Skp family chaperone for outer membrane proteins